ncbi:MAG: AAA family ATPase [Candidatus Hodarchaeales archaeon]
MVANQPVSNYFIVITGPPASGKTSLGLRIASELKLPFISKDDIKELLFDSLGWKDREWSKKLGMTSMKIMYHVLESNLAVNKPVIIETAFYREIESERILQLKNKYSVRTVQIYCSAEENVLKQRFLNRVKNGNRHPGHGDVNVTSEYFQIDIFDRYGELEIGGPTIHFDSTDFSKINYEAIIKKIENTLLEIQSK